jgi:hypothetical protein
MTGLVVATITAAVDLDRLSGSMIATTLCPALVFFSVFLAYVW